MASCGEPLAKVRYPPERVFCYGSRRVNPCQNKPRTGKRSFQNRNQSKSRSWGAGGTEVMKVKKSWVTHAVRVFARVMAVMIYLLSKTCRTVGHRDLRPVLRRNGESYLLASLHAHQIGAAMCGDQDIAAMVSRSKDGQLIVPTLRIFGIQVFRGSGGKARKGGARAITGLIRHVRRGGAGFLTVDGPNGPRGTVHPGIAMLARKTDQPVFAIVVRPRRRFILPMTWDRLQIPMPFTRITVHFSRPMRIGPQQTLESFNQEVSEELQRMERWYDPDEAVHSPPLASDSDTPSPIVRSIEPATIVDQTDLKRAA